MTVFPVFPRVSDCVSGVLLFLPAHRLSVLCASLSGVSLEKLVVEVDNMRDLVRLLDSSVLRGTLMSLQDLTIAQETQMSGSQVRVRSALILMSHRSRVTRRPCAHCSSLTHGTMRQTHTLAHAQEEAEVDAACAVGKFISGRFLKRLVLQGVKLETMPSLMLNPTTSGGPVEELSCTALSPGHVGYALRRLRIDHWITPHRRTDLTPIVRLPALDTLELSCQGDARFGHFATRMLVLKSSSLRRLVVTSGSDIHIRARHLRTDNPSEYPRQQYTLRIYSEVRCFGVPPRFIQVLNHLIPGIVSETAMVYMDCWGPSSSVPSVPSSMLSSMAATP